VSSKTALLAEVKKTGEEMITVEERFRSTLHEVLKLITPEHHVAFVKFVDQLEADAPFLTYWEQDGNCQEAVRQCIQPRVDLVERMAQNLRALIS
jgi:hypothetical protein